MYATIKEQCRKDGKWRGFRLGKGDQLLVRIRRKNQKNFFLRVDDVMDADKVTVSDKLGIEGGVAHRYNEQCFSLE